MSRWGRGRGGSVALPLDSNLFRENTNCPSAARSAGTVGKWGITSFTSIRSAPYAFTSSVKKPVQDQNSPLTVPVETELPPPKPKKFFKSRNVAETSSNSSPVPQISYAPPVAATPLSPEYSGHSRRDDKSRGHGKKKRSPASARESSPDDNDEEFKVHTKKKVATKAAKKEDPTEHAHLTPNKRYLVRNRNKVINYAEDRSNSPIPDIPFTFDPPSEPPVSTVPQPEPKVPQPEPKVATPKSSPTLQPPVASPTYVKPGLLSPTNKDGKPPPIVLRICAQKGTSRIVSTDSNEGLTSPNSDRHSSMDMHEPTTSDPKSSPAKEPICSPKHEGLKITIKCPGLKEKKKDKKDKHEEKEGSSRSSRSHKRNHHKTIEEEKKPSSPQPGTENYDLYKTLASPARELAEKSEVKESKKVKSFEEIESELARLDSEEPLIKSPRLAQKTTEPSPEPKPPEKSTGRAMRNRRAINYSENDDMIELITANKIVKQHAKPSKKGKNKLESNAEPSLAALKAELTENRVAEPEDSPVEKEDLLDILAGDDSKQDSDNEPLKLIINRKNNKVDIVNSDKNNIDSEPMETDGLHEKSPSPDTEHVFKPPPELADNSGEVAEKPSVKLVITKKKGSIFKSKSLVNDQSALPARRRRHLYKHQWDNDGKGNQTPRREPDPPAEETPEPTNAATEELRRVTRYRPVEPVVVPELEEVVQQPYTSVQCSKGAKEYYTVVKNVKKAHQIQEIGEYQEFNDDVEYILDALQDNNPMSTRCLSAITLASKCTAPAFRMHVRALGTVQKFFSALHDAANDQSLGLCTATVMFVLSQDRLNMDLDRESLELMLNLLESDVSHKNALDDCGLTSAQLAKNRERVRELCAEIKSQGKAKHLDLDNITVGHLAMETLLSLTSKRAGEWFKEELRVLGGVEHILRTIQDCVSGLTSPGLQWTGPQLDTLRKADRCMRVLENVTQQNEENQLYLVSEDRIGVAATLASLLRLCCTEAKAHIDSTVLHTALLDAALPAVKVLINLSHSFHITANTSTASLGARVVGKQVSVMETCLVLLHNQGNFVPESRNFEFSVCVLLLLINLVQNNPENIERFLAVQVSMGHEEDAIETKIPSLDFIVEHFYKREELARRAEENTDAILDGDAKKEEDKVKEKKKQTQDELIEETITKLLAKAGAHMEHSMVGAYCALLLGHVALASRELDAVVRSRLPLYAPLLPTLRKYYSFLNLTASAEAASVAHVKATQKIIDFLETSDKEYDEAQNLSSEHKNLYNQNNCSPSDMPQDMSLSNLHATYSNNHTIDYSTSSSDRMNSSMEADHSFN